MALSAGTRLGTYEIRSLLGSGGMGEVYVAHDTHLQRDVALKLLPSTLTSDPERLRRFEQEARAASALNHPAIVAIYELGHADAQPYISMELVEGQTLRQMLEAGALPPRRALHIAAQIADGLAKAHEAGIVHRDLKPENLMVSPDGFAKILDFGLAKLVDEAAHAKDGLLTVTEHGTRPGSVLGTVGYMSPEQASGQAVDSRADQFSFGLVLYEMLTGSRAFSRPTPVETLSAILREEPPPIDRQNPAVPAPVRWMVDRCLAKSPAERYASTRDLARDLAGARDHFSELAGTPAIAGPPARPARRREAVAWGAVALLGAAVLALALRGSSSPPDVPRPVRFTIAPPAKSAFYLDIGSVPFAISPDGHQLAFVASGDGGQQLWLRSFDSLVSRALPGTEGAAGPFWSPDGLAVGFFTANRMKRVSIASGEVTTICEARGGGGATWSRNGVIVFAPSVESGLYRVAAAGGTATPVTTLDAAHEEASHLFPIFLPDERHFAFQVLGRDNAGVHIGSLDSSDRKRLLTEFSVVGFTAPDYLVFVRDGNIMARRLDLTRLEAIGDPVRVAEGVGTTGPAAAMAVSASGALVYASAAQIITQLTWVERNGKAAGAIGPAAAYMNIALAPDGRSAALDRFDIPGIWLLDLARGSLTRETLGELYESTPVWAPDGKSFVFARASEAPPNLFLKRLDVAGDTERLYRSSVQAFPQSWSPDGKFIAYVTIDKNTRGDIWVLPRSGERTPTPLIQSPFFDGFPRISPDGQWLAYTSNESGGDAVFVTRFPQATGKWPVSTGGGGFPVWRHDGRELFYVAPDGTLMAVPVTLGAEFAAGVPTALFKPRAVPGMLGLGTFYDVADDGRFLINMLVEQTSSPATVVLNWPATIARRDSAR